MSSAVSVDTQPQGGDTSGGGEKASFTRRVIVPLLIMLLGLALLIYPVFATQWNNWLQSREAGSYQHTVTQARTLQPVELDDAIKAAQEYNVHYTDGPVLDPWLSRISKDNVQYQEYLTQLHDYDAMAQVAIPAIDSNLPVYHGTGEDVLQKGVGHLFGSALPVGGKGNHTVLTGHTGLTNATLWDNLIKMRKGDAIYVNTYGQMMKYQVHEIETVLPNKSDTLRAKPGEDLLTLITCTPYGINTHRLLVHAHRVPMDPAETAVFEKSGSLMQWWMWVVLVLFILALAAIAWWLYMQRRKETDRAQTASSTIGDLGVAPRWPTE